MKDIESEKEDGQGAGSATGIFGTVDATPPPVALPASAGPKPVPAVNLHEVVFPPPQPGSVKPLDPLQRMMQSNPATVPAFAPPTPPAVSGAGGFTQMLRMLSADDLKSSTPTTPAAPVQGLEAVPIAAETEANAGAQPPFGGFTDLFGTVPESTVSPVESAWRPVSEDAALRPTPAPATLTAMFESTQPAQAAAPKAAEPVLSQQAAAQPTGPAAQSQPAGGFTQLFRALDARIDPWAERGGDPGRTAAAPAAAPTAARPASEPVFSSPPVQSVVPPPAASTRASEGFTQLLRSIEPETSKAVPAPSAPVFSRPLPSAPVPAAPGSLTALFQGLEAAQPATASTPAPPAWGTPQAAQAPAPLPVTKSFEPFAPMQRLATPPEPPAPPQGAGAFTQMFQSLGPGGQVAPASAPTPEQPESFTQLFAGASAHPARPQSQADNFPPIAGTPGAPQYGGGFSSPTSAPAYSQPRFSEPVFRDSPPVSMPPRDQTPAPGGSLTQLLRTLDSPAPPSSPATSGSAAPEPLRPMAEPLPAPPVFSSAQVRPSASSQADATRAFQVPAGGIPAPPVPAAPQGPGEFTSILNANALRESLRQGGGAAAAAVPQAQPPAANPWSPPAYPPMPQMPGYPAMSPAPVPSSMPGFGAAPMQPAMQMPAMQVPAMQAPQAPAPAAASSRSWLPILLIVIIVLLVGILVAVVLLMKK